MSEKHPSLAIWTLDEASNRQIYLDNNATTQIDPVVCEVLSTGFAQAIGNASSQHAHGRRARRFLEPARERLIASIGLDPTAGRLVFTSGGTEANNLGILGRAGTTPGRIIASAIEHPAVLNCLQVLAAKGFELAQIRPDSNGAVTASDFENAIDDDTRLVTLMAANNETGVEQPVAEIAELCRDRGVPFHTDAVQFVGFGTLCPVQATIAISAHKFHGPPGIGALVIPNDVQLEPILFGGFQQYGLRPGTEPTVLAVGMDQALQLARQQPAMNHDVQILRDRLEARLAAEIHGVAVNGAHARRLPNTSNIAFPGVDRQALQMALDLAGVACSTGSACASGSSERSHVLTAMGLPDEIVDGSLRFSLSRFTRAAEIDSAADRIIRVVNNLRRDASGGKNARSSRQSPPGAI